VRAPSPQRDQEFARVRLQAAQLVELRAVPVGDHPAVLHARGRLFLQGFLKTSQALGRDGQVDPHLDEQRRELGQRLHDLGQELQRLAQAGELARAHALQREARADSFHIGHAPEDDLKLRRVLFEAGERLVPRHQRRAVA
jgi:hypothetical protein